MEENKTGKKYCMTRIALYLVGAAVFLQVVEYVVRQQNIEFRICIQVIKGIFLWLAMPITVVFSVYHDFFREKSTAFWRYFVPVVLTVLIVGASFFRGLVFFFNEMVTEETMEDGMIRGEFSTLAGSKYIYYEPVFGIFRAPFQGWSDEKIAKTLKERYGEGIRLMETEPSGDRIYQAPGDGPGKEPFYFCVWDGYEMQDNYMEALIKTDAESFWQKGRKRQLFIADQRGNLTQILPDGQDTSVWDTAENPKSQDQLFVSCYSKEDVKFCAADLADWILFVLEDERYPDVDGSDEVTFDIFVRFSGERKRPLSFDVKRRAEENDWTKLSQEIQERLMTYAEEYQKADSSAAETENNREMRPEEEDAAWEEQFLASYQGDYEKEVFLQDGVTGYRMVVLDAALGSRIYGLVKSTDGGETWKVESKDPFGESGMGIDFTFLDESFGFATLMHNGGDEADLFVTENGGKSYERCVMQGFTVTLDDGYVYNPYDYPQMPYEENGTLYVLCGQGVDGDYDGGDGAKMALYESVDHGHTFVFKEMKKSQEPEG